MRLLTEAMAGRTTESSMVVSLAAPVKYMSERKLSDIMQHSKLNQLNAVSEILWVIFYVSF